MPLESSLIFLFCIFLTANSQSFCTQSGRLSAPQQIICNNILGWDRESRKSRVGTGRAGLNQAPLGAEGAVPSGSTSALPPMAETIYDCLSIQCICSFLNGIYTQSVCRLSDGSTYGRVVRKEYRVLTASERALYRQGFLAVRPFIYWELSLDHSSITTSPGAHSGPAFLPWHREFLKRLEIGIRTTTVNGRYPYINVSIPYWDGTMDYDIYASLSGASSAWSVLFTSELMGSVVNGFLNDGQFGGFQGTRGRVTRALDRWPGILTLMQRNSVNTIIGSHTLNQVLAATAGGSGCPAVPSNNLELIHGNNHVWIGGNMELILTSTNDPMFFLHHCYIDFVFEQWRLTRQTRSQRELQWNTGPVGCYSSAHRSNAVMTPFTAYVNIDGLSNTYTDNLFTYQARPVCSSSSTCPSSYLFCNRNLGRCVSRVHVNSPCRIISGIDPCYNSACSVRNGNLGRCVAAAMDQVSNPSPSADSEKVPVPDKRSYEKCFNRAPCCQYLASSYACSSNPDLKSQCPASCKVCTPTLYKLRDDCRDRHVLCAVYRKDGRCDSYPDWMAENCRRACGLCAISRRDSCAERVTPPKSGPKKGAPKSGPQKGSYPYKLNLAAQTSPKQCYNHDRCCRFWARNSGCDLPVMKSTCSASCSCTPIYNINSCSNFIKQCPIYAEKGLCWLEFIKENCRRSCSSCFTQKEEEQSCSVGIV